MVKKQSLLNLDNVSVFALGDKENDVNFCQDNVI